MSFKALQFLKDNHIKFAKEGKNIGRGWVGISCPFCEGKNAGSMHAGFFAQGDGHFNCWRCSGHSLVDVIMELLKCDFHKAIEIEKEYTGTGSGLRSPDKKINRPISIELPGEPLKAMHRKYLKARGFDPDFIEETYKVKGGGISGDYRYRILVPIFYQGNLVSFIGRDITGRQEPRYKNLANEKSIITVKNVIYEIDNVPGDSCCVVEGVFDQWKLGAGFVATFGTTVSDNQIKLLSKFKRVVFLFDPEKEAQAKAKKAAVKLSALGISVEILNTEFDHDPGDFTEKEVLQVKKEIDL